MSFYEDFKSISSDGALKAFLHTFGFKEISSTPRWNLGQFELVNGETTFRVGYRWYDPSQAFSIQKDIHKAELWSIDQKGNETVHGNISFPEDA